LGLTAAELADGYVLLCQARALTDLVLEPMEIHRADEVSCRRLPCRIERANLVAPDVMQVFLRLPAVENFRFLPGQYIDVLLRGGRRRSFSIASPPHDAKLLELHVRHVPGGEFTDDLFGRQAQGSLLEVEGPLGHFVYPPAVLGAAVDTAAGAEPGSRPLLLVGGGTGLAPLQSILRHVLEVGDARDLRLYWGARGEHDLYADSQLRELASRAPQLRYVPVLSEPPDAWAGRRGWVHAAVLADLESGRLAPLADHDIYASGPPGMVAAVRSEFLARGADAGRLWFDSFDYAADSPARQRSSAVNKS
jgi:CDP-4-dehydro-6-deoxyglucose reductase